MRKGGLPYRGYLTIVEKSIIHHNIQLLRVRELLLLVTNLLARIAGGSRANLLGSVLRKRSGIHRWKGSVHPERSGFLGLKGRCSGVGRRSEGPIHEGEVMIIDRRGSFSPAGIYYCFIA